MADEYPELRSIARKWIDDAIDVKPSALKPSFHYTDAGGLFGMLNSSRIWLTDYRFLNDKTEITHTRSLVSAILEERRPSSAAPELLDLHASIRRWMTRDESAGSFVFSLSMRGDDLSQWRGYAREGLGFTIQFDSKVLHRTGRTTGCIFAPVEYGEQAQRSAIASALEEFEQAVSKRLAQGEADLAEYTDDAAWMFDWVYENRGPFNKHKSFAAEDEWRMVQYVKADDPAIKVRVSGARLVPYVEVAPHDSNGKLPIQAIGIGPGFETPEIVSAVQTLLRQCGYDGVRIHSADTPYRRV